MGSLHVNITNFTLNITAELNLFSLFKSAALGVLVVWTVIANCLVFVVLYKNPRLQTVPNLLVGNLAFSDLCLGSMVLPFSAVYAVSQQWLFGKVMCELWLSTDILCCTASIWNLSMIGLDRYWAITAPIKYMNKRTKKTALLMIASVWALSLVISIAPFLGWKSLAKTENYIFIDNSWQCNFMELPSYTIYSATGSFFVPTIVMLFVYWRIYKAFEDHKARQIYRQKVIRKHIESTILHDISHVLPTSDEFDKEKKDNDDDDDDEYEDDEDESGKMLGRDSDTEPPIIEEAEEDEGVAGGSGEVEVEVSSNKMSDCERRSSGYESPENENNKKQLHVQIDTSPASYHRSKSERLFKAEEPYNKKKVSAPAFQDSSIIRNCETTNENEALDMVTPNSSDPLSTNLKTDATENLRLKRLRVQFKKVSIMTGSRDSTSTINTTITTASKGSDPLKRKNKSAREFRSSIKSRRGPITYERVFRHKNRKERRAMLRKSIQEKPKTISAAKEKRGVKVLGIILGCYLVCWTPFFVMYLASEFAKVSPNPHIEQFITWLGYSNSAMNPIIYTVFNRDYQNALKRLLLRKSVSTRL